MEPLHSDLLVLDDPLYCGFPPILEADESRHNVILSFKEERKQPIELP